MTKNKMEIEIHGKIINSLIFASRYFITFWKMLFHPRETLFSFLSKKNDSLSASGTFLVINILIAYFVGLLSGYTLPKFPFEIPYLQNIFGSSTFLWVRYILGLFVFLICLKLFLKYKDLADFIFIVFPILCYSSVVYIPITFLKGLFNSLIANDLINLLSSFLSDIPLQFGFLRLFKYLSYVLLLIIFLIWWLWLVYIGIRFLKIQSAIKLKKAMIFSLVLFFTLQLFTSLVYSTIIYWPVLKSFKIIIFNDIENELSKIPPNYFKAALLAGQISTNKKMPEYFRYVSKLKKVAYMIATPFFNADEAITSKALKGIQEKKYTFVQEILTEYLKKLSHDDKNVKKPLYSQLIKDLEEAKEISSSSNFINYQGKTITIYFIIPPSLISLFP